MGEVLLLVYVSMDGKAEPFLYRFFDLTPKSTSKLIDMVWIDIESPLKDMMDQFDFVECFELKRI